MVVTIEPLVGRSLIDPNREVRTKLYRIRVDGKHAGTVPHAPGSGICLSTRFSPLEITEIENQVAILKGDLSELPPTAQPGVVPPSFYDRRQQRDTHDDDFD